LDAVTRSYIEWTVDQLLAHQSSYTVYDQYYDTTPPSGYATQAFTTIFGKTFDDFDANVCKTVVDACADRLTINSFDGAAGAKQIWDYSHGDVLQDVVHRQATKLGDCYLIVWPDAQGKPRMMYSDPRDTRMHYNDEDPLFGRDYASKRWTVLEGDKVAIKLNLYFEDRIEKYVSYADATVQVPGYGTFKYSGMDAFQPRNDEEGGPILENPYGVIPVFHFRYQAGADSFGASRMIPAIPLQKALNVLWSDLLGGADLSVLRQKWGIACGDFPGGVIMGPNRLVVSENPEAKFGTFDASSLTDIISTVRLAKEEIASSSRTPLHMLSAASDSPSGESLKMAEAPLVKDVESCQVAFGGTWAELMDLALRMAGTSGSTEPVWEQAESRMALTDAQAIKARFDAGLPQFQALIEMGYTETEVEEMLAREDERQASKEQLGAGLMLDKFRAFDTGAASGTA
jgi:hypothetical protein